MSLILAVGAQNLFVLRQGILRSHVFAICLFAAISDALLIWAGVLGFELISSLTTQKQDLTYTFEDGFHYFTNDDTKTLMYPANMWEKEEAEKCALKEFKNDEEL